MSAYEELSDPTQGPGLLFGRLLLRAAAEVARSGSFPPPEGKREWDKDAVAMLASKFISGESNAETTGDPQAAMVIRAQHRLQQIRANTHDDASLLIYLRTSVRNYLKDEAKATVRGRLRRRLEQSSAVIHALQKSRAGRRDPRSGTSPARHPRPTTEM